MLIGCLLDADWCLQSDVMTNLRHQAERVEKARQEKVAADKLKAQAKLKETMIQMQKEVDRTIANLAKGYG